VRGWLDYPVIATRHFTHAVPPRVKAPVIVIHSMESPEKPGTARAVASWFGSEKAPKASAHFCVDSVEVIQCVSLHDIAWHAPGANRHGIGIELAGRAGQSRSQWTDDLSLQILERSARLVAELMGECGASPARITPTELRAGFGGICGHADVTKAYPERGSGHWDPGPHFPWDLYMNLVSLQLGELARESAHDR
jgi:N-acetyl-anhydromuramyl-L-alanine amidase AmpD